MLLLGIDTSGRHGSIALARGNPDSFDVLEVVELAGGTYSARLIPGLIGLLQRQGVSRHDLEGFAIVSGPGSFTGLRVGLSAVKGLAEILRRPIAAVSMLEAIVAQSNHDGGTVAAIDAGRKEIFAGEYEVRGGEARPTRELLLTYPQFVALMDANATAQLITPESEVADLVPMHLRVKQIDWPNAGEIARLGYAKIQAGQTVTPAALEANYIRRSDAEIFSKPGS
ncbi:MAG: tRNA (adenosine(37)-N6)-threonylcarbamoyltransferase complex dimerization subunit type 1 TsaB [Terriglobales bacterium]